MSGKQLSYDYVNVKRDLGNAFDQIIKQSPTLSVILSVSKEPALNTKHEWLEDIVSPQTWALNAGYTAGSGAMVAVSTVGMKVGDILQFELASGARTTLLAKIATIANATDFTITVYGGSTDVNIASGSIIQLLSRPKNEATDATADDGYEPTVEYNNTQIFDRTAKVSNTSIEIPKYGIGGALDYQVERQLMNIAYEFASTTLNQARVARTANEAGTMGGIMWFLKQGTGNSVNASASAISKLHLNNAFEVVKKNGGTNINLLVCHPVQARKISDFNTSGTNPMTMVNRADTTTGSYVTTYVSDQGDVVTILADRNFDKDKVALLDTSKIKVVPLKNRAFFDIDATPAGADYTARRVLGEYTLEVKNASNCHAYIYGLTM